MIFDKIFGIDRVCFRSKFVGDPIGLLHVHVGRKGQSTRNLCKIECCLQSCVATSS